MKQFISIAYHQDIAQIALNRPEAYNAFHIEMITELARQLTRITTDPAVRGVVLCGEGKAFCAGGDLKWAVGFAERAGASFHALAAQFHAAIVEIRRMKKPPGAAKIWYRHVRQSVARFALPCFAAIASSSAAFAL